MFDGQKNPRAIELIEINGNPNGNWISQLEQLQTVFTAEDGFCVRHKLNATNISKKDLFSLNIMCGPKGDKIHVKIADTESSPYYMINAQTLRGQAIEQESYDSKYYGISFEEIHRLEESGECTQYGEGAKFKTYADCVAHEQ